MAEAVKALFDKVTPPQFSTIFPIDRVFAYVSGIVGALSTLLGIYLLAASDVKCAIPPPFNEGPFGDYIQEFCTRMVRPDKLTWGLFIFSVVAVGPLLLFDIFKGAELVYKLKPIEKVLTEVYSVREKANIRHAVSKVDRIVRRDLTMRQIGQEKERLLNLLKAELERKAQERTTTGTTTAPPSATANPSISGSGGGSGDSALAPLAPSVASTSASASAAASSDGQQANERKEARDANDAKDADAKGLPLARLESPVTRPYIVNGVEVIIPIKVETRRSNALRLLDQKLDAFNKSYYDQKTNPPPPDDHDPDVNLWHYEYIMSKAPAERFYNTKDPSLLRLYKKCPELMTLGSRLYDLDKEAARLLTPPPLEVTAEDEQKAEQKAQQQVQQNGGQQGVGVLGAAAAAGRAAPGVAVAGGIAAVGVKQNGGQQGDDKDLAFSESFEYFFEKVRDIAPVKDGNDYRCCSWTCGCCVGWGRPYYAAALIQLAVVAVFLGLLSAVLRPSALPVYESFDCAGFALPSANWTENKFDFVDYKGQLHTPELTLPCIFTASHSIEFVSGLAIALVALMAVLTIVKLRGCDCDRKEADKAFLLLFFRSQFPNLAVPPARHTFQRGDERDTASQQ